MLQAKRKKNCFQQHAGASKRGLWEAKTKKKKKTSSIAPSSITPSSITQKQA
jgi:hypothetical protein